MDQDHASKEYEVLLVEVGGRLHALPAADVREVVPAVSVVPLPGVPAEIEGVFNYRGSVVPVLDPRGRLRVPPKPPEHTDHLVVMRAAGRLVALRVDRATELRKLDAAGVGDVRGPAPGAGPASRVGKVGDSLVLIHDPAAILTRAESEAFDHALAASGEPTGEGRP